MIDLADVKSRYETAMALRKPLPKLSREEFIAWWLDQHPLYPLNPTGDGYETPNAHYRLKTCRCGSDVCMGWTFVGERKVNE